MRASISSQLRTSLQGLNIANEILEQAVQLVTNDNLDLGCAVMEQAATEKVSSADCIAVVVTFFNSQICSWLFGVDNNDFVVFVFANCVLLCSLNDLGNVAVT